MFSLRALRFVNARQHISWCKKKKKKKERKKKKKRKRNSEILFACDLLRPGVRVTGCVQECSSLLFFVCVPVLPRTCLYWDGSSQSTVSSATRAGLHVADSYLTRACSFDYSEVSAVLARLM